jgi:hypothetical protein
MPESTFTVVDCWRRCVDEATIRRGDGEVDAIEGATVR